VSVFGTGGSLVPTTAMCNSQADGNNIRHELSLSQSSKNDMSFLLSPMVSLQQNQRARRQNSFCPEVGVGEWHKQCIYM
jgi:hypothetical protein